MFCAESRELEQSSTRRPELVRGVERPLQRLHPAERAADHAVQPLDPEMGAERAVHRHEVLHS